MQASALARLMHHCSGRSALHRHVHYFHGFDPASTARYRRIFVAASERLGVTVADMPGGGDGWRAVRDGVTTDLHYLRYEDLVRAFQRGNLLARLGRGLRAMVGYASDGALARLPLLTIVLAVSPYIVAFTPVIAAAALSNLSMPLALVLPAILAVMAVLQLWYFKVILAADLFAFMRVLAVGTGPEADRYDNRLAMQAQEIETERADEVLIVGHSLGGIAAIHAVAGMLNRLPRDRRISLLTLGSVHGIVLAQRGAGRDRLAAAIAAITADARVFWVDVTSPRDAFCLPLTDPLLLIGDMAQRGMTSPRVVSAQLRRTPRIPGDRRTVFRAMRRHMGYLLAPPKGAGFDYADIVTGAPDLPTRYRERGNSPKARMWQG